MATAMNATFSADPLAWAHPLTREWFVGKFGTATEPQEQGWPHILAGHTTLISAPTGSGKTLAAFLACIDMLVRRALNDELKDETSVVYVSPLKALSNDIQKNLDAPLAEIRELADLHGIPMADIRTAVRTGDTPLKDRQAMLRKRPHILVTTPESLYILLTADKSREMLRTVETVIVDEIHAVADDKRGAHLSITLERLAKLTDKKPNRIGLSATQNPIELVAEFLTGSHEKMPVVVNVGHRRVMDIAIEVPKQPLQPIASQELSNENFDRIAELVRAHRSTLVFVNTRKQAERVAMHLGARLGEDAVACHHGSLSRHLRLAAEQRLKEGDIQVLVATASLELGIDIGFVDLVCQVNTVKTIATALQRIGRAGHWRGAIPKGRIFPFTRDELMEAAALVRAINHGDLDKLEIPESPLDILAQQIVAMAAVEELDEEQLYADIREAYPFRNLTREKFEQVIQMLSDGISSTRGRYGAYLLRDRVNGKLKARRGARLAAITSGGAIPESALYGVIAEPEGINIGTLDEHFAIDSHRGDVVLLGNTSWRIRRIDNVVGKVYVEDAHGDPPSVPFWFGEAPARTDAMSFHVSDLRRELDERTKHLGIEFGAHVTHAPETLEIIDWVKSECGVDSSGAEQMMEYIIHGRAVLGAVPTINQIIAERFFDEGGGMQLIIHAPFGGRINRAWGLALRKKFCRSFNFELQAAATEDGLAIALAEQHSFPLGDVFYYLSNETVRNTLEQASLVSPFFQTRWRWDAMRSLALLRFMGGKKVPPYLQRLRSDDLLAAVFPQAAACQDNIPGDIEVPDHPLIEEVMKDVLTEAMDLAGLQNVIEDIKTGKIKCLAVDTPTPSQFAAEILNSQVYTYLDDAGPEERRTRAVKMRRVLPASVVGEFGQLDSGAIAKVIDQAWPDIQSADELHDILQTSILVPERSERLSQNPADHWIGFFEELRDLRRATTMVINNVRFWVSTERVSYARLIWPEARFLDDVPTINNTPADRSFAIIAALRGWMAIVGPVMVSDIVELLQLPERDVEIGFAQLESEGAILRGQFSGRVKFSSEVTGIASLPLTSYEWCDRRLLARIHRATLATLRKGVEPVTAGVYARWLANWQHVAPGTQMVGERGLLEVLKQLQGFELPANAWEANVLPQRVKGYQPSMLDNLCMKGAVGWGRLSIHAALQVGEQFNTKDDAAMKSAFLKNTGSGDDKTADELPLDAPISLAEVAERKRAQSATPFAARGTVDGTAPLPGTKGGTKAPPDTTGDAGIASTNGDTGIASTKGDTNKSSIIGSSANLNGNSTNRHDTESNDANGSAGELNGIIKGRNTVGNILRGKNAAKTSKLKAEGDAETAGSAQTSNDDSARTSANGEVIELTPGLIKRVVPSSVAPIAFYVRDDADWMTALPRSTADVDLSGLSQAARSIVQFLRRRGASFFADIVRGVAIPNSQVELGLWELVTAGLISADGFDNLRMLIDPNQRRGASRPGKSKRFRDFNYGRWTLLHSDHMVEKEKALESMCRLLLNRYGVVFRDVVQRETNLPPWRELLSVFRTLEDRGLVRGGRFVHGFIGEQFALPEAVDSIRAAKNRTTEPITVSTSASDPINLIGTILPGDRNITTSSKLVELSC